MLLREDRRENGKLDVFISGGVMMDTYRSFPVKSKQRRSARV